MKKRKTNSLELTTLSKELDLDMNLDLEDTSFWTQKIEKSKHDNRHLYLTGEITQQKAQLIAQQIRYLNDISNSPITLYINSEGGSVYDGFVLVDAIKSSTSPIVGYVTGACFSFALIVFASCSIRACNKYAQFMLHSVRSELGTSTEIDTEIEMRHLKGLNLQMCEILANSSILPKQEWFVKLDKDNYFDSNYAQLIKLVHEVC